TALPQLLNHTFLQSRTSPAPEPQNEPGSHRFPAARGAGASALQRVLADRVERPEPILPADLLAFLVGPAVVADGDLVDPRARAGDLGGDLRLEAEPVLLDAKGLQELAPERLVASLHVRQVRPGGL